MAEEGAEARGCNLAGLGIRVAYRFDTLLWCRARTASMRRRTGADGARRQALGSDAGASDTLNGYVPIGSPMAHHASRIVPKRLSGFVDIDRAPVP